MPTHQLLSQVGLPELSREVQPSAGRLSGPYVGGPLRSPEVVVPRNRKVSTVGGVKWKWCHLRGLERVQFQMVLTTPDEPAAPPPVCMQTHHHPWWDRWLWCRLQTSGVSHSAQIPQIIPLICNNILDNMCNRGSQLCLFSSSGRASGRMTENVIENIIHKCWEMKLLSYGVLGLKYAEGTCSVQFAYDNIVCPSLYSFIWILQLTELVSCKEKVFFVTNSKTQMIISYIRGVAGNSLWRELKQH